MAYGWGMSDLFFNTPAVGEGGAGDDAPLAERLRPTSLGEIIGQEHLTGPDGSLTRMVASGRLPSLVLWGPPGCGKTSIARLLAEAARYRFMAISAIFSGVADLKKVFAEARDIRRMGDRLLLFVDEIHRFNRAQLDAFLPVMEDGTITLVGATTQNPSFELNAALLSRAQLLVLKPLDEDALVALLDRAESVVDRPLPVDEGARQLLLQRAEGDGRNLLNQVELVLGAAGDDAAPLDAAALAGLLNQRPPAYDKDRDGHYNLISALHKAMRGSDPDAALYYLERMLTAGEDPLYVLRRITRFASEDVGLADPQALVQCHAALSTYQLLGSPEGELAIVQACLYCATAPKSHAIYIAEKVAKRLAKEHANLAPPAHILNAPTKLMSDVGYGKGYQYDHDMPDAFSGQDYWPEALGRQALYAPSARGYEKRLGERLEWWAERREAIRRQHEKS